MKTICVIQARMGSSRLPGKILMPLDGVPVLAWVTRACVMAPGVDEVWIATSMESRDDVVEQWCRDRPVACFRGSETDVLARFAGVAEASGGDVFLRVTADEPFVDPSVIGYVVRLQKETGAAYCSNVNPRTFADGLDVECFTREALMAAHAEATRPIDRDTVTQWIARNRSRFPAEAVINPIPAQHKERWVLDTQDDLRFCQEIAKRWKWQDKSPPSQLDILGILDKEPKLRAINASGVMNERYFESVADEPLVLGRSYERSQKQYERARKLIPVAAQTFSKSCLQFPQPSPLFLTHGQGGVVWDVDGNEMVDMVSALLPNVLGYRDPDVDQAVRRQLCAGVSFSLATELEAQLAETLCRLIPCAEMVKFAKNGTDVTTAAVRLARAHTGRDQVLICGGYHGWADWSVERNRGVPDAVKNLTTRIQSGHQGLDEWFHKPSPVYAAVIVEPNVEPSYLKRLRDYCDKCRTVLIFDEVITGFRYDLGGAQKLYGVTPDLACFGKAMANGMPLSALVGKREIMRGLEPPDNAFFSGTFFGETLSLAASIATIGKMERENVISHLWQVGAQMEYVANKAIRQHGIDELVSLHGELPFMRLKFANDDIAALFRKEMIASGTLIIGSHNVCYAHGPNEIKRVGKSYDHTCAVIAEAVKAGTVAKQLAGASISQGVRS